MSVLSSCSDVSPICAQFYSYKFEIIPLYIHRTQWVGKENRNKEEKSRVMNILEKLSDYSEQRFVTFLRISWSFFPLVRWQSYQVMWHNIRISSVLGVVLGAPEPYFLNVGNLADKLPLLTLTKICSQQSVSFSSMFRAWDFPSIFSFFTYPL